MTELNPELRQGMKQTLTGMHKVWNKHAAKLAMETQQHMPTPYSHAGQPLMETQYSRHVQDPYMIADHYAPRQPMMSEHAAPSGMLVENHYGASVSGADAYRPAPQTYTQSQTASYAVFPVPDAGKTLYDIANQATGQKLAGGLHLRESADGIARLMNSGYSFYSPQIRNILELEQNYARCYHQANSLKKAAKSPGQDLALLESQFNAAKSGAVGYKQQILNVLTMC